jgi:hypothetical protein
MANAERGRMKCEVLSQPSLPILKVLHGLSCGQEEY